MGRFPKKLWIVSNADLTEFFAYERKDEMGDLTDGEMVTQYALIEKPTPKKKVAVKKKKGGKK